jgi:hypothetical protein
MSNSNSFSTRLASGQMLGLNLWGLHQHGNTTQHTTAWHNAEQRHQQQQQQGQSLSTTHGASHHTEIQVTLAITTPCNPGSHYSTTIQQHLPAPRYCCLFLALQVNMACDAAPGM